MVAVPKISLPYNFQPRFYQVPLYNTIVSGEKNRAVAVWHRRAGKDKTLINIMTVMSQRRVGAYYYFFPTFKQGRRILWEGKDKAGFPFLSHIPRELMAKDPNNTEMKILLRNGSLIQIIGTDDIDTSAIGTNCMGAVFSEYALQNPSGWDFVRPIFLENGGWAIFNFTPRGHNHAYELIFGDGKNFKGIKNNPRWHYELKTIKDTGVLTEADIDRERQDGMDEDLISQEFYCSFEAAAPGAYYAKEMGAAMAGGRICRAPIVPSARVDTWWDLGMDDSTSIWFTQDVAREIRAVWYYENQGEGINHYVREMEKWGDKNHVLWGQHTLPHDGKNRSLAANGKSVQQVLHGLGVRARVINAPDSKETGIQAVREILPQIWFDEENCARGIQALKEYRKEWDEVNKVFALRPVHDWACLVGETKVLTRYGLHQIMDLPNSGEVQTLCGWKEYQSPRVTKRDARLVEVAFKDGLTVKCTPDHLFLTNSGWKYAEHLEKGSLIRSALMRSHSISMDHFIENGLRSVISRIKNIYTEKFGEMLLAMCQMGVIYTTKMGTLTTMSFPTLNVFPQNSIFQKIGTRSVVEEHNILQIMQDEKRQSGMVQKKESCGTNDTPKEFSLGRNGKQNSNYALDVGKKLRCLLEKMGMLKSIAPPTAEYLLVENVENLNEKQDVWCLTVPSVGHFSLENGAVVHNSHGADAMQTLALGHRFRMGTAGFRPKR